MSIISGSADTKIKIWQSEAPFNCLATLTGHAYAVNALAILLSDSNKIISGSDDKTVKIWQSVAPYECITTLYGHTLGVYALSILSNSIISGSYDTSVKIWEFKELGFYSNLINKGHTDSINS